MQTLNRPARALRNEHVVTMRALRIARVRPKGVFGHSDQAGSLQREDFRYSSTGTRFWYQDWAAPNGTIVPHVLETREVCVLWRER